jgi:catechol 2,3-dioxygenase-like lactoylglutathione lyase family enzyme
MLTQYQLVLTAYRLGCYAGSMKIRHVNHIGINVDDLEAAKTFFTDLGFTVAGESTMEGKLLDEVIGLKGAQTELVMLVAPDSELCLEVIKYHRPADPEGIRSHSPNTHGLGHIAFEVEDLDGIVESLKQKGYNLVGSVQNYENIWKLCYIYGPEGIIVELAEQL